MINTLLCWAQPIINRLGLSVNKHLSYMINKIKEDYDTDFNHWPLLTHLLATKHKKEGEYCVRAGDVCNEFFFISKGLVRVYYTDEHGNDINEGFYDEGSLLGPISCYISGQACQYNIQALEACEFVVADYHMFHQYASDKPELLNFEIRFMHSLFVHNAKRDAKRLLKSGEQRYQWFCKEYPHLLERIPQYHIASFLGMTAVSLSRLRKNLRQPA